jgi:ADP-heptose:LPS heptosyltransferase
MEPSAESLPIRKIAVLRALFLGDLLCATPALRALRERFPAAEITLIGLPWARELVDRLSSVDRLLAFPGYGGIPEVEYAPERTAAFLAEARAYGYDLAIQMHGDGGITNGFVAELGARQTLGYRPGAEDPRLDMSLPYLPHEHEVLRWLRLIEKLQIVNCKLEIALPEFTICNLQSTRIEFPLDEADYARADELLYVPSDAPLVGLHPGSKLPSRRWPAQQFGALAEALIERYGARIVITGGASEWHIAAAVRRAMHHPALDLTGDTDLGTFAAAIARMDLLVTNDTGASHVAAASGTPSVAIFGPSRPHQWAPLDRELHRIVDAWALAGYPPDPVGALHGLPLEPVLQACEELLGGAPRERAVGEPADSQPPGIVEPRRGGAIRSNASFRLRQHGT